MTKYTIFIFRRDLRLEDNLGLQHAIKNYTNIIPIFIFTPEQVGNQNSFRSDNAIQFMCESLQELDKNLKKYNSKLHFWKANNIEVLKKIKSKLDLEAVVFNQDYTPYAIKRDTEIEKWCVTNKIKCDKIEDYLLAPIGTILKSDKKPYTIFTPFKNQGFKTTVNKPQKYTIQNLTKSPKLPSELGKTIVFVVNPNILVRGGRKLGVRQLKKIKELKQYNKNRNTLSITTSHLSAYIKFGCISIREVYHKIVSKYGKDNNLLDQLFWREFYFYITYYFPQVLKGKNYNSKYDSVSWTVSKSNFEKWCQGETGYPVVDAGMKELNTTGYMHNRARLITSNFLNRMLGMDWRLGEKYFAQKLIDYDPSVNNGNWQWIASTGTDPKPYFQRLFSPMLQSKKSDLDATYIKKWLPQLEDIPATELHDWEKYHTKYDLTKINYVAPIVNYSEARKKSVEMYRAVLK